MNATVTIVVAAMFLIPVLLLLSPALYGATKASLALATVVTRRATEATPRITLGPDGTLMDDTAQAEPTPIPVYDLA